MEKETLKSEEAVSKDNFSFVSDSNGDDDIIASLAKLLNTSKEDLIIHSRKQHLVRNRDLVMYILREFGEMSYPAIGKLMGGRDHTTIIHAYKKIRDKIKLGEIQGIDITELINQVKGIKEQKDYIKNTLLPKVLESIKKSSDLSRLRPKEIPERSTKILELYREGLTLANIANLVGITRERVRQIIGQTIQQIAINDSFHKGITMDGDVLIEEAKKIHTRNKLKDKLKDVTPKKPKELRWSRLYLSCKSCNLTAFPHVRNGLCEKCIGHYRGERRLKIIANHKNSCDSCNMERAVAIRTYGRDFYITKDQKVLCQKCFRKVTGKTLGGYKNFQWSRFYSSCISCSTTTIPYSGNGLCKQCHNKLTPEDRDSIIKQHGEKCDVCKIKRDEAVKNFDHDLFVTKERVVICMKCHLKSNRKKNFQT